MMTDDELIRISHWRGIFGVSGWQALYRFELNRPVSAEEVLDAHRRLFEQYWRDHPDEKAAYDATTKRLQDMARSTEAFWRSRP